MAEPPPPVIIKLNPDPDEPEMLEFYSTLGMCISSWAFVDRRLYQIFHHVFGGDMKKSGLLYYRNKAFNQKLRLVDETVRTFLPKDTIKKHWQPHHDRAFDLSHTRNVLAHHPVIRRATSRNGLPLYTYTIRIEPYERVLNLDYRGLRGKEELGIEDLKQHDAEIERLVGDLSWFTRAILKQEDLS